MYKQANVPEEGLRRSTDAPKHSYKDAVGREIQVGDVIMHISRKGSAIYTDIGVVRKRAAGSIIWNKVYDNAWRGTPSKFARESVIYRTDRCVVLADWNEARLVETCSIGKGETNADGAAEDKDQFGGGGLTPRSL